MNNISSWEAQTRELLSRIEREMQEIQADSERRLAILQERRWGILQALEAYAEFVGSRQSGSPQLLSSTDIKGKSHREILRLIAGRNDGRLIARNAIKLMKESNVFGDSPNADSIVYAVLNRSPEFVKLGSGVYRLNGTQVKSQAKTKRHKRRGLKKAVKELKKKNPQMTKKEVKNYLIRHGFDFEGKNPGQAVHMAWVNLGYAKAGKQPSLLGGIDAHRLAMLGIREEQKNKA